ncbi:hypothetical protein K502DRAFT_121178 [Neoconidiobolus thromboides FSU 785]|nr:hypothetical protein K502DRAFT_121178 [Neoconidiobolus thromboides FSU 785]
MIDENHEQNSTRNKAQQELTVLEDKIEQLGYDPQKQHEYSQLASELSKKIKEANESKQIKIAERGNLEFKYSDPYPNFDRSKVKGLVAELFSLDDKQYATALEICAGVLGYCR